MTKTVTLTEARRRFGSLIDSVRAGESLVITARGMPVARLEPMGAYRDDDERIARLERAGIIRRGTGPVSLDSLPPSPKLPEGVSAVDALLEERRTGW